jgi:hypothetical protein
MRLAAALVAIGLATGTALHARAPVPLTKPSVRAMPAQVLTRRLFGDLGRIMLPNFWRGQTGVRPTQPLRRLEFLTVPRVAGYEAGLCESSWVTVEFEPVGPLRGAETVVRPARVRSVIGYLTVDPRRGGDATALDDAGKARLDMICRRIDPRTRNLFSAREPQMAMQGRRLIFDLVEGARAHHVATALDCTHMVPPGDSPLTAEACVQAVARFDLDSLGGVEACGPAPAYPPSCYLVTVENIEVRFTLGAGRAVEQVRLEPMIVFADTRRD